MSGDFERKIVRYFIAVNAGSFLVSLVFWKLFGLVEGLVSFAVVLNFLAFLVYLKER